MVAGSLTKLIGNNVRICVIGWGPLTSNGRWVGGEHRMKGVKAQCIAIGRWQVIPTRALQLFLELNLIVPRIAVRRLLVVIRLQIYGITWRFRQVYLLEVSNCSSCCHRRRPCRWWLPDDKANHKMDTIDKDKSPSIHYEMMVEKATIWRIKFERTCWNFDGTREARRSRRMQIGLQQSRLSQPEQVTRQFQVRTSVLWRRNKEIYNREWQHDDNNTSIGLYLWIWQPP